MPIRSRDDSKDPLQFNLQPCLRLPPPDRIGMSLTFGQEMNCICKSFLTQLHASELSPCIGVFTQTGGGYIIFGSNCRVTERGVFLGTGTELETHFNDISSIEIPQNPHPTSDELENDLELIGSSFPGIPFIRTTKHVSGKSQEVLTLSFQPSARTPQAEQGEDSKPDHASS